MCGTPQRSRTTRTGAVRPSTRRACRRPGGASGAGAGRRHAGEAATAAARAQSRRRRPVRARIRRRQPVPDRRGDAALGSSGLGTRLAQSCERSVTESSSPCLCASVANVLRVSYFLRVFPAYTIPMALKDGLLAEYDHEIATTRKLLERLPDDKLSWKPHEKSMSLGGLATHLGNIPHWGGHDPQRRVFRSRRRAAKSRRRRRPAPRFSRFFDESTQTDARGDGQERRRVPAAVGAQARRTGNVLDAARRRVSHASC